MKARDMLPNHWYRHIDSSSYPEWKDRVFLFIGIEFESTAITSTKELHVNIRTIHSTATTKIVIYDVTEVVEVTDERELIVELSG